MPSPTSGRRGLFKKYQGQGWVCTICPATRTGGQRFFPNFKAALNHGRNTHDHEPASLKNGGNADGADGVHIPENDLQTVNETCWGKTGHSRLTSEDLRQWEMHAHVDHVFDLVPFWQRGIDAAEKGEVLRLEEFLEKMEGDGGWRTTNEVLGMLGEWKASPSERGWGQPCRDDWDASRRGTREPKAFGRAAVASQRGGCGAASTHIASDATGSSRGRDNGWGIRGGWPEGGSDLKTGRGMNDGRVKTMETVGGGRGREEPHNFVDAIARQEAVSEERRRQMHLFFEMPMEQKIQKIEEMISSLRTHTA